MTGWWTAAFVTLWIMVLVLLVVVVALARQVGTLHLRLGPRGALEMDDEGPALGEAPPPAPADGADGRPVMLGGPGPTRLVLFSSPTCGVCREVAPAVAPAAAAVGVASVVLHDPDAEREWNVPGTPFAVILDPSGVVRAKGTVNNLEQIEGLLDTARVRMREDAWAS
jgi:methylamine dehydrogenase accessory protein MauD